MPLPELQYMDPGHVMIGADSGMQITPQAGYIEGLDRALAMSAKIARALLLEPFLYFASFAVRGSVRCCKDM